MKTKTVYHTMYIRGDNLKVMGKNPCGTFEICTDKMMGFDTPIELRYEVPERQVTITESEFDEFRSNIVGVNEYVDKHLKEFQSKLFKEPAHD